MKKILLMAGIIVAAATATFANENIGDNGRRETRKDIRKERRADNRTQVSYVTKSKFAVDFPNARNVRFIRTKDFDQVSFITGEGERKILTAYYDIESNLVGTTQNKTFADLPENSQKEIQKRYAGYKTLDVIKFVDDGENERDMTLFNNPFDDADAYFVELAKANQTIVVKVDQAGYISYFKDLTSK
jgi:hypothetical protein